MKNKNTLFGFVDESGTTGVARGDNDFLFLALVLFNSELSMKSVRQKFSLARKELGVKQNYEFHYSRNKPRVREKVFSTMRGIDFEFIIFAIKKGRLKGQASYTDMAGLVLDFLKNKDGRTRIVIDTNPALYKVLNKARKIAGIKNITFEQEDSEARDCLQLADYVVSGGAKFLKTGQEKNFEKITRKGIFRKIRYN